MKRLAPLAILSILAIPSTGASPPTTVQTTAADSHSAIPSEATVIYECRFDAATDRNWDNWPDGWIRKSGPGYPRYVLISMDEPDATLPQADDRTLTIAMDGGAAFAQSRPIAVSPSYAYMLSYRMCAEGLAGHRAVVTLTAFDANHQVRGQIESSPVRGDRAWRVGAIGPWSTGDTEVRYLAVGIHVVGEKPGALAGRIRIDDIRLARLPRMTLEANAAFHLFSNPSDPVVTCRVSGITQSRGEVRFALVDERSRPIAETTVPLEMTAIDDDARGAGNAHAVPGGPITPSATEDGDSRVHSGVAAWRPPVPGAGFYRVLAVVGDDEASAMRNETTLAIVRFEGNPSREGIFGWTVPRGEQDIPLKSLAQLAPIAGLHWIKFPVWSPNEGRSPADHLAWFAERMGAQGIEFVGMFNAPPERLSRELLGDAGPLPTALVFREPEVWKQLVNPIMTRLSLKVRWWQLGADQDASYMGYPNLAAHIAEIREHLERFGQEARIAIAWNWLDEKPGAVPGPWARLTCFAQPAFTAEELSEYLRSETGEGRAPWVVLEPLRSGEHDLAVRARDLALRMLAAHRDGASAAFLADPCDEATGLIHADGTPRELFIPWRTVSIHLAGAKYLGEMRLPGGSSNGVYEREGEAVIVVWNDQATRESIYLGAPDRVRRIDLWGRESRPDEGVDAGNPTQVFDVGREPVFLVGADLAVAKVRIGLTIDKNAFSTALGEDHVATIQFQNQFPQGVSGKVTIHAPREWSVEPRQVAFKAAAEERVSLPFRLILRASAASGEQPVRIDFDVRADTSYRFSVHRMIRVGLEDVSFELSAILDDNGGVVVEQQLVNKTDAAFSFNCLLFAPDMPAQRRQVLNAARGRRIDTYQIRDGRALTGKTLWMRAEEIGGKGRILNYPVSVSP
ncbi:MAG: hypothetical protein FJ297_16390 [Planctomycetes bacterium]|nr:hypothetical protein [Planctomycetota bacterium]